MGPASVQLETAESVCEHDFVASVLAEPRQYSSVAHIDPQMFTTPAYARIWSVIRHHNGQIAPAALYDDLVATAEGRQALADLDPGHSVETIRRLMLDGTLSGDALPLAHRIYSRYVETEMRRAIKEGLQDRDPDIYARARRMAERILSAASAHAPAPQYGSLAEGARAVYEDYIWREKNPGKIRGIKTGFGAVSATELGRFDRGMEGLRPGELSLWCGHTGGGKTLVLCAMSLSCALTARDDSDEPNHVAFFSLEMGERPLAQRWIANMTGIALNDRYRTPEKAEKIKAAWLQLQELERDHRLRIFTSIHSATIDQIVHTLRRLKREGRLTVAFIDYAQIIGASGSSPRAQRHEQLDAIGAALKIEAETLQIPIVMAAQLSRPDRDAGANRPEMGRIADAYALVRHSDNVHHIWFPADYLAGDRVGLWKDIAVVLTDKARTLGFREPLYYHADRQFSRFVDVSPAVRRELEEDDQQALLRERSRKMGTL